MFCRFLSIFFSCTLILSLPASGLSTIPVTSGLERAATLMKTRDYRGARKAAENLPESGAREFLAGMAAFKADELEEAAGLLGKASDVFPLLADYALSAQSQALYRLGRFSEALTPLDRLLKNHPESPLIRSATLLRADLLQEKGDFPAAIVAYQKFIEKYPAGNDSLTALYKSALTRDLTGDTESAVISFRQLWLNNPASSIAAKAETELKTIAARGVRVPAYKPDELFRRGVALYDLKKFSQAVAAFSSIPVDGLNEEFRARLALKTGQALLKARQYREAEQKFNDLIKSGARKEILEEATFWLAKSQDKNGKEDAAVATYLKLADASPRLAEEALLEAAFVRKWQKREIESLDLLKRLIRIKPESGIKGAAGWEVAWLSYRTGDREGALEYLKKLTGVETTREKALYWYGKALAAAGDKAGAESAFASLVSEYPLGYYALSYRNQAKLPLRVSNPLPADPRQSLALPDGYERAKALIAFGLRDEARKELAILRKKQAGNQKTAPGLARLYLEIDDYASALNLLNKEKPKKPEDLAWGMSYPLAFRESVEKNAAATGIEQKLIYAVIRAESSFSPTAISPVGAVGLMQLMPATATAILGKDTRDIKERLTLPSENILAGAKHLQDLLTVYKGNRVAVVAAYNAGSGAVNRWLKAYGHLPQEEFIESIPYGETREYVKKVLAAADIYDSLYGFSRTSTVESPPLLPLAQDQPSQPPAQDPPAEKS